MLTIARYPFSLCNAPIYPGTRFPLRVPTKRKKGGVARHVSATYERIAKIVVQYCSLDGNYCDTEKDMDNELSDIEKGVTGMGIFFEFLTHVFAMFQRT